VTTLAAHLEQWGALPHWTGAALLDELDASGLRGHGGAWFPVGTKWRSVLDGGRRAPVVVANGAEGEPASAKDRLLLHQRPHLVLDGAELAALALGAGRIVLHVPERSVGVVTRAIDDRRHSSLGTVAIDVVVAPERFLAGQESAVVGTVNRRNTATPSFTRLQTVRERGVEGRPTLVQNVETLAHVALIARFGADWFRSVGTPGSPGTALVTVTGRWIEPRIMEVPLGVPLQETLSMTADDARTVQGVLLGGYGGGWVKTGEAARSFGSSLGCGVVALLPIGCCPLVEVSQVVAYLEGQGAGQCGPCVNGLAALARSTDQLALRPANLRGGVAAITTLCGLVEGRGACQHPDGVARFVRTGLQVFADHAAAHIQRGPCRSERPPFLLVPGARASRSSTGELR
jgi:NADH:ubiquinone oxidoreductase subunit F (NADH-binding)